MARGSFLGQPRRPSQESLAPALPNVWGSSLVMHPWFDIERPNSAWFTYGEGRALGVRWGQSHHCISASRGFSAIAEFLVI